MRKLIVSMNITLDGFVAGSNSELDWHFQSWDAEMASLLSEQLCMADTILLGRITYDAMASYWPSSVTDPHFPRDDVPFADMMNNYSKIVFSTTKKQLEWQNSKLINGNIEYEIGQLKKLHGKDIIVYGSSKLVSSLMQLSLIDEYRVWLHPVVLGSGKPLFKKLHEQINLRLVTTKTFSTGVVMLNYGIGC
ncbi:MAG: dihydrofolate reductase [Bacteroidetes bacterium]|nr:dihydrofolate reductase [Bacteroidota bacterium]